MPDGRATSNHVRALRWIATGIAIGGVAVSLSVHDWALMFAWAAAAIGWAEAARSRHVPRRQKNGGGV